MLFNILPSRGLRPAHTSRVHGPCSRLLILSRKRVHEPCHCDAKYGILWYKYGILGAILQTKCTNLMKKYCFC